MKKFVVASSVLLSVFSLSACSMFYPNWGATDMPTTTPSTSASASETPIETPAPTSSPEPSKTPTAAPTPTYLVSADVQIMDASPDATDGTLTVVAQVNNVTEDTGKCTLTIKASGVTKKFLSVKAESNATFTQCFSIVVPLRGLASGPASVQVAYDSATANGTSNFFAVTIP